MTVLARELDEYQRALDTYARQARGFNNKQKAFQDSVLKDANGNIYLASDDGTVYLAPPGGGEASRADLPGDDSGLYQYGLTPSSQAGYSFVRDPSKSPGAKQEVRTGVWLRGRWSGGDALGPGWSQRIWNGPATRWDPNSFSKDPGEWTKTQPTAPEYAEAAARRMARPSLAAQEGGLISDVIRTR